MGADLNFCVNGNSANAERLEWGGVMGMCGGACLAEEASGSTSAEWLDMVDVNDLKVL
jgi:hypothetical protein